jgi:sec-independent protein translocase protein TatA
VDLFAPGHLIPLLIVVAVLFFGWKQLPDMARSVGRSLRIFKTEMKGMGDDDAARDAQKASPSGKDTPSPVASPPAAPTELPNVTVNRPASDHQPPAAG